MAEYRIRLVLEKKSPITDRWRAEGGFILKHWPKRGLDDVSLTWTRLRALIYDNRPKWDPRGGAQADEIRRLLAE